MAQSSFDKLIDMVDSRYRLSMIVGRRAAQLKIGVPSVLEAHEEPRTRNTVSVALKELELDKPIVFGTKRDLPTTEEVRKMLDRERKESREREADAYSVSVGGEDGTATPGTGSSS